MKSVWEYARKYEQKFVNFNSHAQSIFGLVNNMIFKHIENPMNKVQFIRHRMSHLNDSYYMIHTVWFMIGKTWKTHPEIIPKFQFSGACHRPYYWKIHPFFRNFYFGVMIKTLLLENSSICQFWNFGGWQRPYHWKTHPN